MERHLDSLRRKVLVKSFQFYEGYICFCFGSQRFVVVVVLV